MATKNIPPQKAPTPNYQPPTPKTHEIRKYPSVRDGDPSYGQREDTVSRTRPVPPDPDNKK